MVAELLAKSGHLHVDRPLRYRIIFPLHGVDDLRPRKGPTGPLGEELQQAKLRQRQVDRLAGERHFVPAGVNDELVER